MNRCVLTLWVCLLPSAVWAERMVITKASTTYWTATGMLEFHVETDKPFDIPGGYLALGAVVVNESNGDELEWFGMANDYLIRGSTFRVSHTVDAVPRDITTVLDPIEFSQPLQRFATMLVPLRDTQLEAIPNVFVITVGGRDLDVDTMQGTIGIDQRIVYVPEPSSLALASMGFLGALLRLVRRPRFRERFVERHVRRKPILERAVRG